jgi:hypothetical protein
VTLNSEQSGEMNEVTSKIEKDCPEVLEKLFAEGDKHSFGEKSGVT